MTDIRIKRGSSLSLALTFANADGTAFDLSIVTVSGTVRDPRNVLVASLGLVLGATPGTATITVVDTSGWPQGLLKADLFISDGTVQTLCETFGITVTPAVTYTLPPGANYDPVTLQ